MTTILILLVIWFGCGFVEAGWITAYWRNVYCNRPRKETIRAAIVCGVSALVVGVLDGHYKYGWKAWWRK